MQLTLSGQLKQFLRVMQGSLFPRLEEALGRRSTSRAERCLLLGFASAEDLRYRERTTVERVNARLKDEFGGRMIRVRGHAKVMCHLMFGIVALAADQILRLVT